MSETYDEYSELVSAHLVPPSVIHEDYGEDLLDIADGAERDMDESTVVVDVSVEHNEDNAALTYLEDGEADPMAVNEEEVADGAGAESDLGEANDPGDVDRSTSRNAQPPFAVKRVKQLLRLVDPAMIVGTEAATVTAHAAALIIEDLARSAAAQAAAEKRKTVTYRDVAFAVSQLARFAYLRDIIPTEVATIKSIDKAKVAKSLANTRRKAANPTTTQAPKSTSDRLQQTKLFAEPTSRPDS